MRLPRKPVLPLAVSILLGLVVALAVTARSRRTAAADDSARATALVLDADPFDFEQPAVPSVSASLTSSEETDARMQVDLYYRLHGAEREVYLGSMWNFRNSDPGAVGVKYQLPRSEFYPASTVRARFTTFDAAGATTSASSREVEIP